MTVAELKKYLQMHCVTVNGYLKPALLEIAQAVEKMMLPVEPTNEYSNEGSSEDTYLLINKMRAHRSCLLIVNVLFCC